MALKHDVAQNPTEKQAQKTTRGEDRAEVMWRGGVRTVGGRRKWGEIISQRGRCVATCWLQPEREGVKGAGQKSREQIGAEATG